MSFIKDLMAKGVSRAGAVEVLLGQPLSLATDRSVLTRLAIPAARESLSQPPAVPSLIRVSDRRITQIVSEAGGAPAPGGSTSGGSLTVRTQTSATPVDPRQARINSLNASIRNVELAIQNLTNQLLRLAVPPPGMPLAVWQAQVRMLRNLLQNLRNVLALLMQQLVDLTTSSRGTEYIGSLNQAQSRMSDLESDDDKGSNGPIGGGA